MGKRSVSSQRGFTIIELMIAVGVGAVILMGMLSFLAQLAEQTKHNVQKLDTMTLARDLSRAFMNDGVCTKNTSGLRVFADPVNTTQYFADFPAGKALLFNPDIPKSVDNLMAEAGENLPRTQYPIPVRRIALTDLVISNPPYNTEFRGALKVEFGNLVDPNTGQVARRISPIKVYKKFYVRNGIVQSCSSSPQEVVYVYSPVLNFPVSPPDDPAAYATCPVGMVPIGGGWVGHAMPEPDATCAAGPQDAAVLMNVGGMTSRNWYVTALCHAYQAIAICLQPTVPN